MKSARLVPALGAAFGWLLCVAASPATLQKLPPRPTSTTRVDCTQRINANAISLALSNLGAYGYDFTTGGAGLEFPKGSGLTSIYSAGLWVGATVAGLPRVTIAGNGPAEYLPGSVINGVDDSPANPDYKVYKLYRVYPSTGERDSALADYVAHAVPHGAPPVQVRSSGALDIQGEQMCWSVFNDLDGGNHTNPSGRSLPLGIEVQQTTTAFAFTGAFDNTVLMRFKVINRGVDTLKSAYFGIWVDPDLGGFSDDKVGCIPASGLCYSYNATNFDALYGTQPPALGYDLLQGPLDRSTGTRSPMTACVSYGIGSDPASAAQSYQLLRGLTVTGTSVIDPITSQPTTFMYTGDPIASTGWLDPQRPDVRMLLSAGPVTMAPGDAQELVIAIILARGTDRLNSLQILKSYDLDVQASFNSGTEPVLGVGNPAPTALALRRAYPNPTFGPLTLTCSLADSGPATLDVVDVSGRRVLSRSLSGMGAGEHEIRLGEGSARIPAGMYFARLTQGSRTVSSRIVELR